VWDLPHIVESIDGAESTVRVQLLTYGTVGREGTYFDTLDAALRRAAARGVDVRLLVADWSQRPGTIEGLKSLEVLPHVRVRLVTIPPWSGGFVPYARVIHAKYLAVDGRRLWLGTSNWERDYFYASRNVGLIVESASMAARLDGFFEKTWSSPYAAEVDPCAEYEPPRRSR
jgi:phosphatidylserine/phosphatidylglycerophosphate/cardiolipin synthase-like enzyme